MSPLGHDVSYTDPRAAFRRPRCDALGRRSAAARVGRRPRPCQQGRPVSALLMSPSCATRLVICCLLIRSLPFARCIATSARSRSPCTSVIHCPTTAGSTPASSAARYLATRSSQCRIASRAASLRASMLGSSDAASNASTVAYPARPSPGSGYPAEKSGTHSGQRGAFLHGKTFTARDQFES